MSSWLSMTPSNFHRFVALHRSVSRSMSPEREIAQMTQVHHVELLYCGSPVYDPVSRQLRCPDEGHVMRRKRFHEYDQSSDGVMCNFCGTTVWFVEWNRLTADGQEPACTPGHPTFFVHCSSCIFDVCEECVAEIVADSRYHAVCMVCRSCGTFMREEEAVIHRCASNAAMESEQQDVSPVRPKRPRSPNLVDASPKGHETENTWEWCIEITTSVDSSRVATTLGVNPTSLRLLGRADEEKLDIDERGSPQDNGERQAKQIWRVMTPTRLRAEGLARKARIKSLNVRVVRI